MAIPTLHPREAERAIAAGALLVDIREPDEFAREHIAGAVNIPLAALGTLTHSGRPVVFHCRSGARTAACAAALEQAAGDVPCHILDGGLQGWRAAGLATRIDRRQPLEIMRQVQLAAGALVLAGVVLGLLVAPGFFAIPAFVGGGLMFAGATGWCSMARLLRVMPWNRRATA